MNNVLKHKIYLLETNYVEKNTANPVYKIGRTCQCDTKMFAGYPKDFDLVFLRCCVNSVITEKIILYKFRSKYIVQHKNKYFSGNIQEMIKDINQIIDDEEKQITIPEIEENNEILIKYQIINPLFSCEKCNRSYASKSSLCNHKKKMC